MKFAIVDIETTGLYHQGHGITEIAVVCPDLDPMGIAFHSLVKPERKVPEHITHITGIDNKLTDDAPLFEEIADSLMEVLEGRVFVAHNVNFDYQFLKAAYQKLGKPFRLHRLCTMRYARKLMPELRSHRLAAVCKALDVQNAGAHRAGGDTIATAKVFKKLRAHDVDNILGDLLKQNNTAALLPPQIDRETVLDLPELPGVYYFENERRQIIYIGKAKNLKKRVISHFTSSGSSSKKQLFQREIKRVSFRQTLSEYEAFLLEDAEIKSHWPKYNRAQKERVFHFNIVPYETKAGEHKLGILKRREPNDLPGFNSFSAARNWLYRALLEWEISPRVAGFMAPDDFESKEKESELLHQFINHHKMEREASFVLREETGATRCHAVAVLKGKYHGFGVLESKVQPGAELVEKSFRRAPDSPTVRAIIRRMINDEKVLKYEL
ncbi:MAG TPA: exonuclease domain-containing protein [Cryomorphaceae bacterium]|nr:exonuclease domain-containing protein [Cryomorphaceae bacterium]